MRVAAPSLALLRLCYPLVILPPSCHNRPSRGPRPRDPLWLQPPPSCTACPGRAVRCGGPLQRAAAARWGRVQREAQAVVTGEHEGRATGGAARKCRLFYLSAFPLPVAYLAARACSMPLGPTTRAPAYVSCVGDGSPALRQTGMERGEARASQVTGPSSSSGPWSNTPPDMVHSSPTPRRSHYCLQVNQDPGHPGRG